MVDEQAQGQVDDRGEDGRRRRGSRGGRGRGSRSETEAPRAATPQLDEPRIVGRRPGRPALGPAAETPRERQPESASPRELQSESGAPRERQARAAEPAEDRAVTATPARTTATRRGAAVQADGQLTERVAELAQALTEQNRKLSELQERLQSLGEQVERSARHARLGIFVDVPNLLYGTDRPIDMGRLLDYLSDGREVVRATAYAPVSDNPMEPVQQQRFVAPFVPYEYRIVTKPLKRFADGSIKGNFDVEMAVDMLTMADRLDVVAIVSGDADFARVVEEIQSKGVRVEVVAFAGSTSQEMRALADRYVEVGAITHLLLK
ncbi:MAG: NYN domain-containing protein [Dehalococcoidia bacterium]|nr:NYN domain-containing protein [Dehalococcoidia bacterium]